MNTYDHLFIILWMLFGIYFLVLIAILADLWSGVRKARRLKIERTSEKYRKTIVKLGKYYNTLVALTVIDAMQCLGIWYLDTYYGYKIPIIPIITIFGAIGIGLIEIKSIYENRGTDSQVEEVANLTKDLIANKDNIEKMTTIFMNFLNSKKNENL